VATSPSWKPDATEWHKIICWRKLAEIVSKYVKKGDRVAVVGRLSYNSWEDKDGNKRVTAEILADEVVMLGGGEQAQAAPVTEVADGDLPF
jgi:single-strand DNA-binding protein